MFEEQVNEIKEEVQIQFKLQKKLFRLKAIEIVSGYLGQIIAYVVLALVGTMLLTFASLAFAYYLNTTYESTYIGFVWVAGFYAALLLFLFLIRKPLFQVIMRNAVIANLMELWKETNSLGTDE